MPCKFTVGMAGSDVLNCARVLVNQWCDRSSCIDAPWSTRAPAVVCSPAVQMLSFTAIGTPARGPSCLPPPD